MDLLRYLCHKLMYYRYLWTCFPTGSAGKESTCNAWDTGDGGSIPGSRRSPVGGYGNLHQYSCLENPTDRGAWWAIVHGVAKSQIRLKWLCMHIRWENWSSKMKWLLQDGCGGLCAPAGNAGQAGGGKQAGKEQWAPGLFSPVAAPHSVQQDPEWAPECAGQSQRKVNSLS